MFTCICWLRASYYEFVNTIRKVQTYLKGNSWSMFWETFLDPITFREIRKHNHILISMNEIRTPPWQQTNDWLTARKTKPYVMANDNVAKRQHIFLASLFARCYRSRYWKFEFTGDLPKCNLIGQLSRQKLAVCYIILHTLKVASIYLIFACKKYAK